MPNKIVKIGIIGFGYWGPNLVRNFSGLDSCEVKIIADLNKDKLKLAQKKFPSVLVTTEPNDLFSDPEIDAVVIASPVFSHFPLAKKALLSGKHVLVEKPMTSDVKQAEALIKIAQKNKITLMVDHTFLYTAAVKKLKELISSKEIGNINYFDSTRINLGLFNAEINVIWDLAPHDISILKYLLNEEPKSVVATGVSHTNNKIENIAYLTIYYPSNRIAHINCSWASPVKMRQILIGGTKKMVVYDDIEPTEKIRIYDSGYKFSNTNKLRVDYRSGDIHIPKLEQNEALYGVATDFIEAIEKKKEPISNWKIGLSVVRVLEAAEKSIRNHGKEIILK
jgi:predicted dehydrogenase